MSTDQILVTAATGNVGRPLVKALQRKNMSFQAATRDAGQARAKLGASLDAVYFDYEQPSSFEEALAGNDLLFLSGPAATPNAGELVLPIVDKAVEQGIKHIVFIASLPKVVDAIKQSGIDYTFLEANFFMQNFELYQIEDIRDRQQIFLPCGEGKATFIHTRDIGEVAAEILARPSEYRQETLELTGPTAIDHFEAASIFSDLLDTKIEYKNPDNEVYSKKMKSRGYSDTYIEAMIEVFGLIKNGDVSNTSPVVKEILNRQPLSLSDYVEENKSLFQT